MKFGPIAVADAVGAILAHSARLPDRIIKKGHVLEAGDIEQFIAAEIESIVVARLEDSDITEDDAARQLSHALAGGNVKAGKAFTGRCNLIAGEHGVLTYDRALIDQINLVDETITVATVPPYDVVIPGQLIATIKVIPFAVPKNLLEKTVGLAAAAQSLIDVHPFLQKKVGLILTRLPGMKESILDKTVKTASDRVTAYGSRISEVIRCAHDQLEVSRAIDELKSHGCELFLLFGASAVVDRYDVLPAGLVDAGGEVEHFGMPVDPGNLLFIGSLDGAPVVGMPGCARSPKLNGFDWVLWRLLAGLEVSPEDIMTMGTGGLLKEIPERGQLRQSDNKVSAREPKIAALILAAGSSRRMGPENKLLADIDGKPLIHRVVEAVAKAKVSTLTIVTGHQAEKVSDALSFQTAKFVHNPDYKDGLATSLHVGIDALPDDIDGVVVCLGDMPLVTPENIDALIDAFDPVEGRAICIPVFGRKRGNPVLWAKSYLSEMSNIAGDVGARHLLEEHADQICEVMVDKDGVLYDIDTPERLAEFKNRH